MAKKIKKSSKNKFANKKSFAGFEGSKKITIYAVFFGIFLFLISIYTKTTADNYDISVIGNGMPTLVQIHDPNCQLCRKLKRNLDGVKYKFRDKVHFKIANIQTSKGRSFTERSHVGNVTLLLFNAQGKRVGTLTGVSSKDEIQKFLNRL
ncbi:MAG: thioredoxin family protein [Cellvibrionaceae bacterium]|nr:thioredoxin family protein [Cellvibrionaceae bacterium]